MVIMPDERLAAIIGPKPARPHELIKRLWTYIKRHKLKGTAKTHG